MHGMGKRCLSPTFLVLRLRCPAVPQLEVLLRLKQAGNAAFSFLSDGDPLHGYYLFLKSWGEDALASEYARQQRLQAERAAERERRKEEEEVGAEEGSEAEAKPKAGTKSSPDVEKATIAKGPSFGHPPPFVWLGLAWLGVGVRPSVRLRLLVPCAGRA